MKLEMAEANSKMNLFMLKSIIISIFLCFSLQLSAVAIPDLTRQVTDEAQILSSSTIDHIEGILKEHEAATSNQIAVLTLKSLEGDSIEEVAVQVFEKWKLGQKSKSNGVLLLIAVNDRKMRIEVGYGLEGALTDLQASRIVKKTIRPKFKAGDMDGGVLDGVNAIIATIKGEYTPSESDIDTTTSVFKSKGPGVGSLIYAAIFLLVGLFIPGVVGYLFMLFALPKLYGGLVAMMASFFAIIIVIIIFVILFFIKKSLGGSSGGGGFFDGGGFGGYGGGSSSDGWSSSDSWGGGGGDSGGGGSSGDW